MKKNLIKSLSEIDLEKDVKTVNENIYKYLQINDENEAGKVYLWLKKDKFKEYILTNIIRDKYLPIFDEQKINLKKKLCFSNITRID